MTKLEELARSAIDAARELESHLASEQHDGYQGLKWAVAKLAVRDAINNLEEATAVHMRLPGFTWVQINRGMKK